MRDRKYQKELNLFSKWCRWSEMTIEASKCHSFGICKKGTTSPSTNQSFI